MTLQNESFLKDVIPPAMVFQWTWDSVIWRSLITEAGRVAIKDGIRDSEPL